MDCEYKKGGRVKKPKAKKAKKAKTPKKPRARRAKRTQPVATGPMPTTGMGSVVFSSQQPPSFLRAVPNQMEFGILPDVLKGLREGQASIMAEINRRKAQEAGDRVFAKEVEEKQTKRSPSPVGDYFSRTSSSVMSDFSQARAIPIRPLSGLLPGTLNSFQRSTASSVTPSSSFILPQRAISPSYTGSMSSKEAISAEPYRGADESLPIQPVATGAQMVPAMASSAMASSSQYIPLGASKPESQGDSLGRSVSAPLRYVIPGTNTLVRKKPVIAKNSPGPAMIKAMMKAREAKEAEAPAPGTKSVRQLLKELRERKAKEKEQGV